MREDEKFVSAGYTLKLLSTAQNVLNLHLKYPVKKNISAFQGELIGKLLICSNRTSLSYPSNGTEMEEQSMVHQQHRNIAAAQYTLNCVLVNRPIRRFYSAKCEHNVLEREQSSTLCKVREQTCKCVDSVQEPKKLLRIPVTTTD